MSSTNRGYDRHISDYYVTPVDEIKKFWKEFKKHNDTIGVYNVLDPSAGGGNGHLMSYPEALKDEEFDITTLDLRDDSLAILKGDYLDTTFDKSFDIIITNPPFAWSLEFIQKALNEVKDGDYVIMLLRLNFLGSKARNEWLRNNMPYEIYVHSKRMSFIDDGKRDSVEYAHFVWKKGNTDPTKLYLLEFK